jgi:O-antigen ligase
LKAAAGLTFASGVALLFSIAAFNILLAAALAALLLARAELRLPPVKWPLGLLIAGTLVSAAFSENPAAAWPQIKKFAVLLILPAAASALRSMSLFRRLFLCWGAAAAASSLWSFAQLAGKVLAERAPGQSFYEFYLPSRTTGFMSHWMTFGSQGMMALLLLLALVLAGRRLGGRYLAAAVCACFAIALGILLGLTRIVWFGTALGALYLLWCWRRWTVAAAPAAAALVLLAAPAFIRERAISIFQPHRALDSNDFRAICRRTGYRIIAAHPWFGIGPQMVKYRFKDYLPADIPQPLPQGFYEHLHNLYLQYAAERGIPTALMLLWLLVKALYDFLRAVRKLPPGPSDRRFLLQGAIAVVIATMAVGLAEVNLGDSEVLAMFLIVLAAGYQAAEGDEA